MINTTWLVAAAILHSVPAVALPRGQAGDRPKALSHASPLQSCRLEGVEEEAICGSVAVPEDRGRTGGRSISLNVVVLKAFGAERAEDPLFVFVGGPGQAATANVRADARLFRAVLRSRDIVFIDQRGTGRSNPLTCPFHKAADVISILIGSQLPPPFVRACRRSLESAADLRLYTTSIAADDVEEVRQRLGYRRINLYGGSYGSRAALVYLQNYPASVRTATLRAVFPPDLRNPLYSSRDAQRAFDLLTADCVADDGCRNAYPDLANRFELVLNRLARQPAKVVPRNSGDVAEISITRSIFAGLVRRMLYTATGQAAVPAMIYQSSAGDFSIARAAIARTLDVVDQLSLGMFLSVTCAEDVRFILPSELGKVPNSELFGSGAVRGLAEACRSWPKGSMDARRRPLSQTSVPVLLLSGALDPVTPPEYAARVARSLSNSRSLVLPGEAHGPFSECGVSLMTDLIASGTLPNNLACLASGRRPPFVLTPN